MDTRRAGLWVGAGSATLALVYACSAGPVVYLFSALGDGAKNTLSPVYLLYLRPHFWVAYHQEWYFGYLDWCRSRSLTPQQSYEAFRRSYEQRFP